MRKYPKQRPSEELKSLGKLFARHIQEDVDNFKKIQETLESMDKKLEPIAQTYITVSSMGKWTMAVMVFISVLVGIIIGIKALFVR